jgi:poly(A) polymerase
VIRAIGDPAARFAEDHLRLLRAVRFAATLDFALDPGTRPAMQSLAGELRRISAERIQQEITRTLTEARRPGQALALLAETGLCAVVLPEVAALQGVEQPPEYHPEGDVFRHTVLMLDHLQRPTPELAWSVLLHDIGKPATQRRVLQPDGRERIRFDGHAETGALLAEQVLHRLRCSNALTDHVVACVRQHMRFMDVTRMRKATLRRMVMAPTFATELELHRVDCLGSHGHLDNYDFVRSYAESLQHEPVKPAPWLRGGDIMATGVAPGPDVKRLLQEGYDLQLEGRLRSREEALAWLKQRRAGPEHPSRAGQPPDPTAH